MDPLRRLFGLEPRPRPSIAGNPETNKGKGHEEMYQHALYGKQNAFGPEQMSTLDKIDDLAITYAEQGKLAEAEKLLQQALHAKEETLGPDHTSTLGTVYNLGKLHRLQGELAKAARMYQRALQGFERGLGPEDISTLHALNYLAGTYHDQGKLAEAEDSVLSYSSQVKLIQVSVILILV